MRSTPLPVVYTAGPYRGKDNFEIAENIRRAERLALFVWKMGGVALCPHLNTANFQHTLPDDVWLEGDIELLSRCDAVALVEGWERSEGTLVEKAYCEQNNIPLLHTESEIVSWLTHYVINTSRR